LLLSERSHPSLSRDHASPSSTLFPYTTLFRSRAERDQGPGHRLRGVHGVFHRQPSASGNEDQRRPDQLSQLDSVLNERKAFMKPDRKSTRLNSSHVSISYAVFCLKKKKRPHKL